MEDFGKTIMNIMGGLFGLLLLGFTGVETFQFLEGVTGNPIVSFIGLVMFEGGFLYWAAVFKGHAKGLVQMAIALLTSIADFLAVIAAVALRLGAVDGNVLGAQTGSRLVVAAVLVNLTAKYTFSLADPETVKNIMKRAAHGMATLATFKEFQKLVKEGAPQLAVGMASDWNEQFAREFNEDNQMSIKGNGNPLAFLGLGGKEEIMEAEVVEEPPTFSDINPAHVNGVAKGNDSPLPTSGD